MIARRLAAQGRYFPGFPRATPDVREGAGCRGPESLPAGVSTRSIDVLVQGGGMTYIDAIAAYRPVRTSGSLSGEATLLMRSAEQLTA